MDEMEKYFDGMTTKISTILFKNCHGEPCFFENDMMNIIKQIFLAGCKKQSEADAIAVEETFLNDWEIGNVFPKIKTALKSAQIKGM